MAAVPARQAPRRQPGRPAHARPAWRPRVVPPPQRRRRAAWVLRLTLTALLAFGVFGVLTLNALAAEAAFTARQLEGEISDLTLVRDDLVAAVAQLESPARVREAAASQLGLMEPEQPGFIEVHPDAGRGSGGKPVHVRER